MPMVPRAQRAAWEGRRDAVARETARTTASGVWRVESAAGSSVSECRCRAGADCGVCCLVMCVYVSSVKVRRCASGFVK